jgi:5-methyltetrahydrofolate--homocysteine methyltransferase
VKKGLFDLLAVQDVGMTVTESLAMSPAASVSGFYFSHPESQYFNAGTVGKDQAADLATRQGLDLSAVERAIAPNLA